MMTDISVNALEVVPPYLGRRVGRAPAHGVKGGGTAAAAARAGVSSPTKLQQQLHEFQVEIESLSHHDHRCPTCWRGSA